MAVRIKIASTPAEYDDLFRVRHRVYVDQGGYMKPRPDKRIYDRFDAFPSTTNLIAVKNHRVIGGVRLTEPSEVGTPADEYFDFRPHLPRNANRVGSASMLCLDAAYHHQKRLISCLAGMFYYLACQRGLSHILAPANPDIESHMFTTGYRRVAPAFRHRSGLPVSPLLLDLTNINDRMARFVQAHSQKHVLDSLERGFYAEGETVLEEGAPSPAAYVVLEGVAFMEVHSQSGQRWCQRLEPGNMFGELSLMTGRPSNITVVAASDLDVMVLDRRTIRNQLHAEPERALALLEKLSSQLLDLLAS